MRLPLVVHGTLIAAPLVLGLVALPPTSHAQSFFETLFGGPKPSYSGAQRQLEPNGGINTGQPYILRTVPQPRRTSDEDGDDGSTSKYSDGRGGHQTVCVRTCDGFYWPVSYSAPRSRFYRDANVCKSSCGSEAKLFHYPTNGGKIEDAVDLSGMSYSRLATAFKYRKTLVKGCACKPEPWSEAEIDRHRVYALNEEVASGGGKTGSKVATITAPAMSGPVGDTNVADATQASEVPAEPKVANPMLDTLAETQAFKPAHAKSTETSPPRSRSRVAATPPPVRVRTQAPQTASSSFWGGGTSKYTWPGDAPVRVR